MKCSLSSAHRAMRLIRKNSQCLNNCSFMQDVPRDKVRKKYGRVIIISKDTDFPELISRLGSPPKLITIKIGNSSNQRLWNHIQNPIIKAISILATTEIDIVEID